MFRKASGSFNIQQNRRLPCCDTAEPTAPSVRRKRDRQSSRKAAEQQDIVAFTELEKEIKRKNKEEKMKKKADNAEKKAKADRRADRADKEAKHRESLHANVDACTLLHCLLYPWVCSVAAYQPHLVAGCAWAVAGCYAVI